MFAATVDSIVFSCALRNSVSMLLKGLWQKSQGVRPSVLGGQEWVLLVLCTPFALQAHFPLIVMGARPSG
jgi:hypothetical protein